MATLQHINQDWFDQKVRQTDDGRASLLDLIRLAIAGRGERRVLSDLRKQHPEIESLIDSVRFSDAAGRAGANATPVVDLEGWLQILPLLPGAAGKKYRQQTAELIVRIWRGDADLGLAIMLRDTDKKRLERANARLRVGSFCTRVKEASYENGERPDRVHDARYRGYYRKHTGQVRHEMGLAKGDSPLNFMDTGDLAIHEAIQHIALKAIEHNGGSLQSYVQSAAKQMRAVYMEAVGSAPVLPDPIKVGYMDTKDARAIRASDDAGQMRLQFG
jgi:hypothetical protein